MKLRSHGSGASSSKDDCSAKEKFKYWESSEEDDGGVISSSDSDYIGPSDEHNDGISKKRKKNSPEKAARQSSKNAQEDEGNSQTYEDNETAIGIDPEKINLTGGVAEKSGNKKGRKKRVLIWQAIEQENDKWIQENLQMDMDLKNQNELSMETVEPSDDLKIPLLRYQKEWLAWALKQEDSSVRGGILADEMGMGKTLQAIALVLLKRSILRGIHEHDLTSSSSSSSRELPTVKGTVVICPPVAVTRWAKEIDRFTAKGSTKVLVYYGPNREKNLNQFSDYDFVITTYSIIAAEFRKHFVPPKVKCSNVEAANHVILKIKEPKSMNIPDVEVCSRNISTDEVQNSGGVHKELKNNFSTEISDDTGLTSSKEKSILHSMAWERIILDEAHCVKGRHSNRTKAVLALQSRYKWALSGTPLQNHVGELYSLVRFLQIVPYSYYFCKQCDCRTLDYSILSECPGCGHHKYEHFCWWNKYIGKLIKDSDNMRRHRGALILLKHKILKSTLLRRTKKGRVADLAVPLRVVTLRRDSMDDTEEGYYTALYEESRAQFNTYIEAGTVFYNYAHIFVLLTRLSQALNHPYLLEYSIGSVEKKGKAVDTRNCIECVACNDPVEDTVVALCGHDFCKPCFRISRGQNPCPSCSKLLNIGFFSDKDGNEQRSKTTIIGFRSSSILNRIPLDNFQSSTKIEALREEIRFMIERDRSAKAIVFSQFSCFLDLIHYTLIKSGVRCVQLDGSISMGARDAAIRKFSEDPSCRIILMTLRTGDVALNLTVASHVFLMDPGWNPAMELQAQDRIHQIGQWKPTRVVRFIIANSIDEKIIKLQEKKESLFKGTVGGRAEPVLTLTMNDIKSLFVT